MPSNVSMYAKDHPIFTTEEVLAACGRSQNTYNMLHYLKRTGRIRQVKRGLYVSAYGRFAERPPAYQTIAGHASDDAVLCHGTAFSIFVGNQDVMSQATFYTATAMRAFTFWGIRYVPYQMPKQPVESCVRRLADGMSVRTTTKERTVVDSLTWPLRSGGIESVLRQISAIRYLDAGKSIEIALRMGPTSCARLGWVLEHAQRRWRVRQADIDVLRASLRGGPWHFGAGNGNYNSRWMLYMQYDEQTMEGWING